MWAILVSPPSQELEQEMGTVGAMREKLKNAESEVKTLKTFVTSKTAMVEKRKAEIIEVCTCMPSH